ncbi:hypothetical protein H6K86_12075 [Staphylococcus epidermidis]|nr:hypothetical protein [Staphylococcus epidermidis]MBM6209883.1 hypothetical protein [Staphylococcus epidermidis]MBM6212270.1 hypothetical protein [Staphylococcus epidermidis]MBM6219267.1 hypothetical protein [Staphylococcus epidermidis]MBM6223789.1 hypothetical protein [Staphylococcus epidermidis]
MLKIKINSRYFEIIKDKYLNGRIALYLYNEGEIVNLTVNIPEAILMSDVIGDEVNSSILNHIDGYNYEELIDVLVESNIITSFQNGEVQCGFNHYKGIIINDEKLNKMRNFKNVI